MPRRKDEAVVEEEPVAAAVAARPAPRPKAVAAIFNPDGNVIVNLTAPSGRPYHIEPRQPFEIAPEDVGWFFYGWDWQYRRSLCRAEDYAPPAGYLDAALGGTTKAPGSGVYHDPTVAASVPKAPGSGVYFDAMLGTPPAPAAEYHDEGGTSPVITAEEREARERAARPEPEGIEPVAAEAGAGD